ncbi:MAG: acetyl-CoA carboxylase biotin carboxyl carrier protein subunit [Anaerolineae bacterium]|jgi:pyruvate carboxylase subunit B|nr:acetyl-CoA carboxylase biotin carboxyl carrier protein subunit [Anaerolineae bacterium]
MRYVTIINNRQFEIEIQPDGQLLLNGVLHEVDFLSLSGSLYSIIKDNRSLELIIDDKDKNQYEILLGGRLFEGQVLDERALFLLNRKGGLRAASGEVHSPMPGLIVQVAVSAGQTVAEGQTLIILESMKMQNELKAPQAGVVQQILVSAGQTVEKGALLVVVNDA